jgi:hypothetical protein
MGAVSIVPSTLDAAARTQAAAPVTVLYDDRSVTLDRVGPATAAAGDALWVRKADLPRINEFEVKPQGACRADVCVPIPPGMMRGGYFNLTAFARRVGEASVADLGARVWSYGEIPMLRGGFLTARTAPDFAVPDRRGRAVHLSSFRGRKVLLVTWASW